MSKGLHAQHFPRAPVAAAFHRWFKQQGWDPRSNNENQFTEDNGVGPISPLHRLAHDSGVSIDFLYKLKTHDSPYVDFDMADKVITAIDPTLWHDDPELAREYQEFDLARLDARRPIVKAAA